MGNFFKNAALAATLVASPLGKVQAQEERGPLEVYNVGKPYCGVVEITVVPQGSAFDLLSPVSSVSYGYDSKLLGGGGSTSSAAASPRGALMAGVDDVVYSAAAQKNGDGVWPRSGCTPQNSASFGAEITLRENVVGEATKVSCEGSIDLFGEPTRGEGGKRTYPAKASVSCTLGQLKQ